MGTDIEIYLLKGREKEIKKLFSLFIEALNLKITILSASEVRKERNSTPEELKLRKDI